MVILFGHIYLRFVFGRVGILNFAKGRKIYNEAVKDF